jgi:hypothetical protein
MAAGRRWCIRCSSVPRASLRPPGQCKGARRLESFLASDGAGHQLAPRLVRLTDRLHYLLWDDSGNEPWDSGQRFRGPALLNGTQPVYSARLKETL